MDKSINLCVFKTSDHGVGQSGFQSALSDGAVTNIEVDNSDCTYATMYNVMAAAKAVALCLGYENIEVGAYKRESENSVIYITVDEMNDAQNEINTGSNIFETLDESFDGALIARQRKELYLASAIKMLKDTSFPIFELENKSISSLLSIGKVLNNDFKISNGDDFAFNPNTSVWACKDHSSIALKPNPETGEPIQDY